MANEPLTDPDATRRPACQASTSPSVGSDGDAIGDLAIFGWRGDKATAPPRVRTLSLLVVARTGPHVPVPVSMINVVVLVLLPAMVAAVRALLVRPAYVLLADFRGATVQLYETRDGTEFGKISRALVPHAAKRRLTWGYRGGAPNQVLSDSWGKSHSAGIGAFRAG